MLYDKILIFPTVDTFVQKFAKVKARVFHSATLKYLIYFNHMIYDFECIHELV